METIQPRSIGVPPVPLSPGVCVDDWIYVSGQVATQADGTVLCGSFEDEVNATLDNVESVLQAAGAGFGDVVKVNAFLASSLHFQEFNRIYAQRFPGAVYPARTTVVVAFGHPDVRVEVEAVAHVGKRPRS